MKSYLVILLILIFVIFSWIIKGILLWLKYRKKSEEDSKVGKRIFQNDVFRVEPKTQKSTKLSQAEQEKFSREPIKRVCAVYINKNEIQPTTEMKSRIRRFYDDVEDILKEIDRKGEQYNNSDVSKNLPVSEELPRDHETDSWQNFDQRKNELQQAIRTGNAEELNTAIEWALVDGCKAILHKDLHKAELKLKELQKLDQVRENLYAMRPGLISELRSYANPPKVVHDVMICVYLLLGTPSDQLKTWPAVQGLLCNTGKHRLRRMIDRFQSCDVSKETFDEVKSVLSRYDFETVYSASEGAAVFYIWILDAVEEFEKKIEII